MEYTTKLVRFNLVNLIEKSVVGKPGQEGKLTYNCMILFAKEEADKIKAAIEEAVQEGIQKIPEWKKKRPEFVKSPLKKADDENIAKYPHQALGYFMTLKSQYEIAILGPDKKPIIDPTEIYSGMWGRANFVLRAYYSALGASGVTAYLNSVQKIKNDEKIGGGSNAFDDDFFIEEIGDLI